MAIPSKHYVNHFNISKTFKAVPNTLHVQGATVFQIAGVPADPPLPFGKRCGTKRLGKGRVKIHFIITQIPPKQQSAKTVSDCFRKKKLHVNPRAAQSQGIQSNRR